MLVFGVIVLVIAGFFALLFWAMGRPDPYDRYLTDEDDEEFFDEDDEGAGKDYQSYAQRLELYSDDSIPDRGKWARFEYEDHNGSSSSRDITMWEKRGIYIVGYDRAQKAERTFRQDRISNWRCG